jgi:hypothetical protein
MNQNEFTNDQKFKTPEKWSQIMAVDDITHGFHYLTLGIRRFFNKLLSSSQLNDNLY